VRLAGGEGLTDADGRFTIALPLRGRAELRIGDARDGIRRVGVGAADQAARATDVGVIDLSSIVTVSLVLEASEGCDLLLSGPTGRAGMTLMRARRVGPSMFEAAVPEPGRWLVAATCGTRERIVLPSAIDVSGGATPASIPLVWREDQTVRIDNSGAGRRLGRLRGRASPGCPPCSRGSMFAVGPVRRLRSFLDQLPSRIVPFEGSDRHRADHLDARLTGLSPPEDVLNHIQR
jgi:hypothetical protein